MRRRIVIGLGLLLALCLIGDVIALLSLDHSIRRFDELAESHRLQSLRASLSFSGLQVERNTLARLVDMPGSDERLLESIWHFKDSLRQCHNCHHAPAVKHQLEGIQDTFETWLTEAGSSLTVEPSPRVGDPEYASIESMGLLVTETLEMVESAHEKLEAKSEEVQTSVHRAWVILCVTLVGVLLFGGIVALHLRRSLTRPLSGLLEMIHGYGHGTPEEVPPISGDAEFRQLGDAFRKAYGELRSAQEGVLEAQKMAAIGQLAAGVAHEVLNPLTGISCLVQLMRREADGEVDAERFELILEHIKRISGILREFQSFSRPLEPGRLAPVRVPPLLDQATELLGYDKRSEGVTIVRDYPADLVPIVADADRLSVVFTNIMINAVDALGSSKSDHPTLTVSARQEGDRMVLRFTDNGPGMTEHDLANAFEPFFTTKAGGAGSGLGLWVCYETVRGHNGRISLDGRGGEGLTVTVELPYGAERAEPPDPPRKKRSPRRDGSSSASGT